MALSGLVLSEEEWKDLGYICRVWRLATEGNDGYTEEEAVTQLRRRSLAERVIEVAA